MESSHEGSGFTHVAVFGDSVSDIGRMRDRSVSSLPGIVLNKWGRFSDGKNWVDFFWEALGNQSLFDPDNAAATIEASKACFTLTDTNSPRSQLGVYAEGGAVAWADSEGITQNSFAHGYILSNLEVQISQYLKDRSLRAQSAATLCIVWIGANDVVTICREPHLMTKAAKNVVACAAQLLSPTTRVLIVDLPDPQYMPRFAADKGRQARFENAAQSFNLTLDATVDEYNRTHDRPLCLFKISAEATPKQMLKLGVAPFAQPERHPRNAPISAEAAEQLSLLRAVDVRVTATTHYATTPDRLHPTELVYQHLAELILAQVSKTFAFEGYRPL